MKRLSVEHLRERLQELFGVTKSELIITLILLTFSGASFVTQMIVNPDDPFEIALRTEIRRRLDSAAAVRDSMAGGLLTDGRSGGAGLARFKAKKTAPAVKIDLNTASVDSLCMIPGVGPALAQRIESRRKKRRFRSVRELRTVKGIGPKTYEKIAPHCVVRR